MINTYTKKEHAKKRFLNVRFFAVVITVAILFSSTIGLLKGTVVAATDKMAVLVSTEEEENFCVLSSLVPGETYEFSLYYKSEQYVYNPIKVLYEKDKNHTMVNIVDVELENELEWYKYSYRFTVPTDGYIMGSGAKRSTNVLLSVSLGAVGNKSWIYDLSLIKNGESADNLLKYPDFSRNFSSYYIYDDEFNYGTRIAGSKNNETLEGCFLADIDLTIFQVPQDEQMSGKMAELVCPFPNASFCTLKDLTPGSTYKFSVYYSSEISVSEPIKIFYQGSAAQWGLYQKINIIENDESDIYRYYTYEFTVPTTGKITGGKTSVLISISMGRTGKKSWVYDLKLTEQGDTEETNLLSNPLFENNFSGYRIYNSNYVSFTEGPSDSDVFAYDYSGTIFESNIVSVNMVKFEKPAPYAENRMLKLDCDSTSGWFLTAAKVEINKTYSLEVYCRSKYIMRDLLGVFYEDVDRNIKRVSDAVVTEDENLHRYTIEFFVPTDNCYLQGNMVNVYLGVNMSFAGTIPNSKVNDYEIYLYEPKLREKDASTEENLMNDAYFKRFFSYCHTVNKSLTNKSTGPIDSDIWDDFELVAVDEGIFNKNATPKMAHITCPYWSAYFMSKSQVEQGKTYIFSLDYFSESDLEEPIRVLYQGGTDVGKAKIQLDTEITEDPELNRYYLEFTVPEDENIPTPVELYSQIILGDIGEDAYVANYSLVEKDKENAENLIINPDFSSNYYGYYYFNHEINTATPGASDSNIFPLYSDVQILDYDETLFVKTESEKIIGTGWASEFGEIRVKKFGVDEEEEPQEDGSTENVQDEQIDGNDSFIGNDILNEEPDETIDAPQEQAPQKGKRKKRVVAVEEYMDYTWIIVVAVASAVVLAGGIVTFLIIYKKKKKKKTAVAEG